MSVAVRCLGPCSSKSGASNCKTAKTGALHPARCNNGSSFSNLSSSSGGTSEIFDSFSGTGRRWRTAFKHCMPACVKSLVAASFEAAAPAETLMQVDNRAAPTHLVLLSDCRNGEHVRERGRERTNERARDRQKLLDLNDQPFQHVLSNIPEGHSGCALGLVGLLGALLQDKFCAEVQPGQDHSMLGPLGSSGVLRRLRPRRFILPHRLLRSGLSTFRQQHWSSSRRYAIAFL